MTKYFQSPVTRGVSCEPGNYKKVGLRQLLSIPCDAGRFVRVERAESLYSKDSLLSIPCDAGRFVRERETGDAIDAPELTFQSPVTRGVSCETLGVWGYSEEEIQLSIPCDAGRFRASAWRFS